MSHISSLSNHDVQAEFYFVCVKSAKLTREYAHECILATFEVSGALMEHQERFEKYVAFIEDNGEPADTRLPLKQVRYPLPGVHSRSHITIPEGVLEEKMDDEAKHKRYPGHKSTVPPAFLTSKTLAMIIGGREFLANCADLYLERHGLLRERLIPLLVYMSGLSERKSRVKDSFIHCPVFEETFYPGNFDTMLERLRNSRMSSEELIRKLS